MLGHMSASYRYMEFYRNKMSIKESDQQSSQPIWPENRSRQKRESCEESDHTIRAMRESII